MPTASDMAAREEHVTPVIAPVRGQRAFDLIIAGPAVLLLSPLFALIALLVAASSRGPVFFWGHRVGRGGRPFHVLKFRTMRVGAHAAGPGITRGGDPRITPVGRWLRRTKLDELPQFLTVLRGDMSVVGPRPEDPRYVAGYTSVQRAVLNVRPGITSPASAKFRHEATLLMRDDWEEFYRNVVLPDKLAIELEYLARRTVWTDLRILLTTLLSVVTPTPGAGADEQAAGTERR